MALLEIKKLGCPTLKRPADLATPDNEVARLVEDLFETMYAAEGVGLAAPQVGVSRRVAVIDVGAHDPAFEPLALVNPEIVVRDGEMTGEEGCLSIPGITGEVRRSSMVRLRALGVDGAPLEREFTGIAARVVQHELDHLDGVLVTERFSAIRRNLLRNQLRRLKREGIRQDPGPVVVDPSAVSSEK